MFYIDQTTHKILLTKGDDAEIQVSIKDAFGKERGIFKDDSITLTVKQNSKSKITSLKKEAVDGVITLTPEDTKYLTAGAYVYDVELKTFTGKTYTIIPQSSFVIQEEITV